VIKRALIFLIRVYQAASRVLSPRRCRYYPSCSQYTAEAIEEHGPVKGVVFGAARILRCHPFSKGGYDPVPGKRKRG
jgi:hypothetical protein